MVKKIILLGVMCLGMGVAKVSAVADTKTLEINLSDANRVLQDKKTALITAQTNLTQAQIAFTEAQATAQTNLTQAQTAFTEAQATAQTNLTKAQIAFTEAQVACNVAQRNADIAKDNYYKYRKRS